jgi:hypothetical protein
MNMQQIAYEQGTIDKWERITRTMDEVRAEHEAGKYVVMFESLSYCPYTDAPMGTMHHILKACKTRAEADALINEYFEENTDSDVWDVYLYPKHVPVTPAATDDFEDIPY